MYETITAIGIIVLIIAIAILIMQKTIQKTVTIPANNIIEQDENIEEVETIEMNTTDKEYNTLEYRLDLIQNNISRNNWLLIILVVELAIIIYMIYPFYKEQREIYDFMKEISNLTNETIYKIQQYKH